MGMCTYTLPSTNLSSLIVENPETITRRNPPPHPWLPMSTLLTLSLCRPKTDATCARFVSHHSVDLRRPVWFGGFSIKKVKRKRNKRREERVMNGNSCCNKEKEVVVVSSDGKIHLPMTSFSCCCYCCFSLRGIPLYCPVYIHDNYRLIWWNDEWLNGDG